MRWTNSQIRQVTAFGSSGDDVSVKGQDCIAGGDLYFDVRDDYAYDIDETVWVDIEFQLDSKATALAVTYDGAGEGEVHRVQLPASRKSIRYTQTIALKRAHFANLERFASDFAIHGSRDFSPATREFLICAISLRRNYMTRMVEAFGWAEIELLDEHGEPTPARMGIYDASGRLPLPSNESITVRDFFRGTTQVLKLRPGGSPWPTKNRSVFYINGRYNTRLPVGDYELIISKGPEYRRVRQPFTVDENKRKSISIKLQRWIDMASKGWYSGDGHIHYPRESGLDDYNLQLLTHAEDINVGNILQMGNNTRVYFSHYDWTPVRADPDAPFVLVPGQEDPRTSHRGHTIALNIKEPARNPEHYLLYHEVFQRIRVQGGLVGYAHVTAEDDVLSTLNAERGMALDVPFGLVDFAEILSMNFSGVSTWFKFLNLGYPLSPSAGTDYPNDVPGTVRSYVKVDGPFTPQAWFDGLKGGRTFVTSGPMLEFSVNGQGMGSNIHLRRGEALKIKATAAINPDIGGLTSLELIEQGDSVKVVAAQRELNQLDLEQESRATHGTWFVLRARGKGANVIALSAPIYVVVDGEGFWKRSEVPSIVANLKNELQELLRLGAPENTMTEGWETREAFGQSWGLQQRALKERIAQADALYDDLAKRASMPPDRGD